MSEQTLSIADRKALEAHAICVSVQCSQVAEADVYFVPHGCPTDHRSWAICQGHLDDAFGESLICKVCLRQGRRHYLDVARVIER